MAWTSPKTWVSEVLTSNDMNTYVSDNTQFLYDKLTSGLAEYTYTRPSTNYSTTSTSWVDVDSNNMAKTLTTSGGDLLVAFAGTVVRTGGSAQNMQIAVLLDGDTYAIGQYINTGSNNASFTRIFNNVSAGSHTLRIRWRLTVDNGTTLNMTGAGAHFSIRELIYDLV